MPLQPSPLLRGFEQGADGEDVWNRMMPGEERGPLTLDPQGVALGQQFQAIKAGIEAQQARPIWDQSNPVGTETVQSMGMPQPTTYAGAVGQFIDPATGRMTEQGAARMQNPALGFDTGGLSGGGLLGSLKAYHGSPHAFDAFSDHAIGTGEGAQAYGYGHYLAENEGVARGYRDALTPEFIPNPERKAVENEFSFADTASRKAMTGPEADFNAAIATRDAARERLKNTPELIPNPSAPGHMYEVNVAADPEKFLHWDKPLSEQHPDVQAALAKLPPPDDNLMFPITPKSLGRDYVSGYGSQALKDVGLPGIRYLDAQSRQLPYQIAQSKQAIVEKQNQIAEIQADIDRNPNNMLPAFYSRRRAEIADHQKTIDQINEQMNEGTHNVVVFDPSTMEIIRRYGLAGLMGGGAAALAGGGNQEQ